MFAIRLSDNEYVTIDEYGKVLCVTSSSIFAGSQLGAKPIKVFLDSIYSLNPEDFSTGEIIKNDNIVKLITKISYSLRESNYVPTTSKGIFTEISMNITNSQGDIELAIKTRNGIVIVIKNIMEYSTDKLLLALERYNYYHQEGVVSGEIEVWYNNLQNKIVARYSDSVSL